VNIPKLPSDLIKGIKVCRQANAYWEEKFDERIDPYGRPYYWLTGEFIDLEKGVKDTDVWAVDKGFVSVVPTHADMTAHQLIKKLAIKLK
jgi:5'-nucleotidase